MLVVNAKATDRADQNQPMQHANRDKMSRWMPACGLGKCGKLSPYISLPNYFPVYHNLMSTATEPNPFEDLEPLNEVPITDENREPSTPITPLTPLEQAQADAQHWKELALRSAAELDNFRKRSAKERMDAVKYANGNLLETLLPVVDNFEFGLQAARAEGENSPVLMGMSMVQKQITDFLKENGVDEIPAVGQKFDPNVHEAVSSQPTADAPEGTILTQLRRGYRLRDRLLRPASVVVAAAPQA
jgi:molecular chaperone GrpE